MSSIFSYTAAGTSASDWTDLGNWTQDGNPATRYPGAAAGDTVYMVDPLTLVMPGNLPFPIDVLSMDHQSTTDIPVLTIGSGAVINQLAVTSSSSSSLSGFWIAAQGNLTVTTLSLDGGTGTNDPPAMQVIGTLTITPGGSVQVIAPYNGAGVLADLEVGALVGNNISVTITGRGGFASGSTQGGSAQFLVNGDVTFTGDNQVTVNCGSGDDNQNGGSSSFAVSGVIHGFVSFAGYGGNGAGNGFDGPGGNGGVADFDVKFAADGGLKSVTFNGGAGGDATSIYTGGNGGDVTFSDHGTLTTADNSQFITFYAADGTVGATYNDGFTYNNGGVQGQVSVPTLYFTATSNLSINTTGSASPWAMHWDIPNGTTITNCSVLLTGYSADALTTHAINFPNLTGAGAHNFALDKTSLVTAYNYSYSDLTVTVTGDSTHHPALTMAARVSTNVNVTRGVVSLTDTHQNANGVTLVVNATLSTISAITGGNPSSTSTATVNVSGGATTVNNGSGQAYVKILDDSSPLSIGGTIVSPELPASPSSPSSSAVESDANEWYRLGTSSSLLPAAKDHGPTMQEYLASNG